MNYQSQMGWSHPERPLATDWSWAGRHRPLVERLVFAARPWDCDRPRRKSNLRSLTSSKYRSASHWCWKTNCTAYYIHSHVLVYLYSYIHVDYFCMSCNAMWCDVMWCIHAFITYCIYIYVLICTVTLIHIYIYIFHNYTTHAYIDFCINKVYFSVCAAHVLRWLPQEEEWVDALHVGKLTWEDLSVDICPCVFGIIL